MTDDHETAALIFGAAILYVGSAILGFTLGKSLAEIFQDKWKA